MAFDLLDRGMSREMKDFYWRLLFSRGVERLIHALRLPYSCEFQDIVREEHREALDIVRTTNEL